MWKYIVTWCIVVITSVPISSPPDEFGRKSNSFWYETRISNDCGHERQFYDRTEAFAFYERAQGESVRYFILPEGDSACFPQAGQLDKVKIDSMKMDRVFSYPDSITLGDLVDSSNFSIEWLRDTISIRDTIGWH
jgi:hypothetical protein